ncbi:carbamoyl-phosphate synthase (glutamine-hydrolyzing) large subunit [Pontibacillus yanchengensis]|uniref:Carbamoyl-phosphate synthase (Glutamine-hydrolyzing) large subunit n=1 Tax=Pontibacillus yanchengensis TaxID=462910 RepID=A0ACC7VG98_9BACI|nr:carbamoyl-phosphate synthase (glutamine-hydrolyzing) large subunit [Pontibacillus yanchengensis]MYL54478.1 carbamoyl-phosphate synthase (glutamine-hydrolyzing) large subunit [Pontibacillus yanchengensis]
MPLRNDLKKVLIVGSGPIQIGQAAEFDYSGTQACMALKEEGIEVVLVNSNPATIMTDPMMADRVYMEPLTVESIEQIIAKEQPQGLIGTLGGQTGLNLTIELDEKGILQKYGVELLGTSLGSIQKGEDRQLFRQLMIDIEEPIPESKMVHNQEEALEFAAAIHYPVIVRPAYTLGGEGGGVANNPEELQEITRKGLQLSPIHQVLVEKSILGWKELEYEVMRDANGTSTIVCNMENMDPVGIHTGDSIVVAPSQTLTDTQYQMLRNSSLKVIQALEIVGGCNIQFGLDPHSNNYYVIEVNPRVSRSSALASKATGYPIASMATKCAIGYHLDEIVNPITQKTYAAFEPALDYAVVKLPRFPFDKFVEGNRELGTQMKATGEVMAIDRTFEGALNKAVRSLETNQYSLTSTSYQGLSDAQLSDQLQHATDERLFFIAEAFKRGVTVAQVQQLTYIDPWFLEKVYNIVQLEGKLKNQTLFSIAQIKKAKSFNISDEFLASCLNMSLPLFREYKQESGLTVSYKQVDTCAGEFEAVTPYYYSTWNGQDEVEQVAGDKVLVVGSGPIRIGQGVEFDYCSVHATMALKEKGCTAVVINNNPETVSTDYTMADRLYFEPLALEDVLAVIEKEGISKVLIQFGGQTAINLANGLQENGVHILGTSVEDIEKVEDRDAFYQTLKNLGIPYIKGTIAYKLTDLQHVSDQVSFPVIVRPSHVIGGQSMFLINSKEELEAHSKQWKATQKNMWPLVIDEYIKGKECEVDAICDGEDILIPGIMEHMERAGVHSGDSTAIYPPLTLTNDQQETIVSYTKQLANAMNAIGMINIQFVIEEDEVYVLEVNPRSSRTVPIMSKVTSVPMIELAVFTQLGYKLKDSTYGTGLLKEVPFYTVKAPAFSDNKLNDVDHALGPEMKSTGEVLGLSTDVTEAIQKAWYLTTIKMPMNVLCSINESEKHTAIPVLTNMIEKGVHVYATPNTAAFLAQEGLNVEVVEKDLDQIEEMIANETIQGLLCTPTQGRKKQRFGFQLRALATRYRLPSFTHLDTFKLVNYLLDQDKALTVATVEDLQKNGSSVHSITM